MLVCLQTFKCEVVNTGTYANEDCGLIMLWCRTDPEAVEILASDIQRLEPLEFLNDTIIDFYIKYDQCNSILDERISFKLSVYSLV